MGSSITFEEGKKSPKRRRSITFDEAVSGRKTTTMESLQRGVIQSPGEIAEQFKAIRSIMNPGIEFESIESGDTTADRMRRVADRVAPMSSNASGVAIESMGKQAIPALVGGTMAGVAGGAGAAIGETALALTSPLVNQGLQSMGASPGQAAAGEIAYNLVAPGIGLRAIRLEALRGMGYRGSMQPGLHKLSANRQARAQVPVDPTGKNRFADTVVEDLVESQRGLSDPIDSRTVDMVLNESAPGFEGVAISKAGDDRRFNQIIGGRKEHILRLQKDRVDQLIPDVPEPNTAVRASWQKRLDSVEGSNKTLWRELDLAGEPRDPGTKILEAMDERVRIAGSINEDTIPSAEFDKLREFIYEEGGIPWEEIQSARARFGQNAEIAKRNGEKLQQAHNLSLIEAIDETIEASSPRLATKYPEAIASHRSMKTIFDPKSKAFKAFDTQENPARRVSEIMDGRDAIQEARRAASMFGDDVAGLNDFKATIVEDTFFPETGARSAKAIQQRYAKRRLAMSELWTDKDMRAFDDMTSAGVDVLAGKAGRRGMNYSTGSGTRKMAGKNVLEFIIDNLGDITFGNDILKNRAFERLLLNPSEMIPVIRAYRNGNKTDAIKFLTGYLAKTAARSAAYTDAPKVIESMLDERNR